MSTSTSLTPNPLRRVVSVALGLMAVAVAPGLASRAGATSPAYTYSLQTPAGKPLAVISSTKKHLALSLTVTGPQNSSTQAAVNITLAKAGTTSETNEWTFQEDQAVFAVGKTNDATIRLTKAEIGNYGSLTLNFTAKSSAPATCESGSGTVYSGTLGGTMTFYTNTTQVVHGKAKPIWGSVSEPAAKLHFGSDTAPVTLLASQQCYEPTRVTCFAGTTFDSPNYRIHGATPTGSSTGTISASATFRLTVPKGAAWLSPTVTAPAPAPSFTPPTATINGSPGSAITGSATFTASSSSPSHYSQPCQDGTATKTENYTDYSLPPMVWKNGAQPLTAHFLTGGAAGQNNMIDGYGAIDATTIS